MATHFTIPAWRIQWTERSLGGYSPWGHKESDMTERLSNHTHHLSSASKNVCTLAYDHEGLQLTSPFSSQNLRFGIFLQMTSTGDQKNKGNMIYQSEQWNLLKDSIFGYMLECQLSKKLYLLLLRWVSLNTVGRSHGAHFIWPQSVLLLVKTGGGGDLFPT